VLSSLFRGKFLDGLKREYETGKLQFPGQIEELKEASVFKRFLTNLYHQPWVVYCKPPLKHPEKVMHYLGRYTHRVALSNDRLVKLVVYPINGTMFGNDYPQQNKLSKCSLKYSVISVVHH